VVHAHGDLRIHEDPAWLCRHLEELTDRHEAGREEPWQVADAPADYTQKLMGAIVGLEIRITRLIGKWKMSQNRRAADHAGIVSGLLREEDANAAAVARWMRELHGT
jgi:transcriptional regulator